MQKKPPFHFKMSGTWSDLSWKDVQHLVSINTRFVTVPILAAFSGLTDFRFIRVRKHFIRAFFICDRAHLVTRILSQRMIVRNDKSCSTLACVTIHHLCLRLHHPFVPPNSLQQHYHDQLRPFSLLCMRWLWKNLSISMPQLFLWESQSPGSNIGKLFQSSLKISQKQLVVIFFPALTVYFEKKKGGLPKLTKTFPFSREKK